jgi:hypothetical protein
MIGRERPTDPLVILIPELPHDPRTVAGLVPQFCTEVGIDAEVEVHADADRLQAHLADGTVLVVDRPAGPGAGWTCVARVPGQPPVTLLVPDIDHDHHRLAAWVAEVAFTTLDLAPQAGPALERLAA